MQNTPARPGEVNMAERRVSGFKSELGRNSSSRARVGRLLGPIKTQAITIASLLCVATFLGGSVPQNSEYARDTIYAALLLAIPFGQHHRRRTASSMH